MTPARRASRTITPILAVLAFVPTWLAVGGGPSLAAAAARQPTDALTGIDVSHHQDVIDWAQVAASGQRFVFAKASEGTGFVDPMYATNRAGATAAGLAFGAYHFARPDLHPSNPIGEADHFVDTAQLGPGNLLPVLDLERSGNLSQAQLTQWILEWLGHVTERTGVRPIVYTSPIGWKNRTGDTTAIADAGYTVLWIAHWNVQSPLLPAADWSGNGWTFWQYSNCGTVPGIKGCVDLDWYDGLAFDPVTIASPDTAAPIPTIATPPGVGGPVTVSFSEIVRQVNPSNVTIRVLDTAAEVPATMTCSSKKGREVGCATGTVSTVVLEPEEPLIPGERYAAFVNPPEAAPPVADRGGNPAPPTQQDFAAPTEVEDNSVAIDYEWRTMSSPKAYGRSYSVEHLGGATASFAFSGRQVTWYTVAGPTQGKAAVSIDGRERGTFDQYAASADFKVARTFRGLARGEHTITIRVLGKRPSGSDTQVAIDAFEAGGRLTPDPELDASWGKLKLRAASRGRAAVSDGARTEATLVFRGTGVEWHTVRGPDQGRAEVYVDGALVKTWDNYGSRTSLEVRRVTGLEDGVHELRIVVLDEGRAAATGTRVTIDGFSVVA
jgi:GH25 family lysozyme M1 (1,4-beta-N-acetylmuramidase)